MPHEVPANETPLARSLSYRLQWLRFAAAIVAFLLLAEATPVCAQTAGVLPAAPLLRGSTVADDPRPAVTVKKKPRPVQSTSAPAPTPAVPPEPAVLPATPPVVEYQRAVSNRINSTGQPLTLPVPLKDGTRDLGEIILRVEVDDSIHVPRQFVLDKISPMLTPDARARLVALPHKDDRIALGAIEAAGLGLTFNASLFELAFNPRSVERAEGELSVGGLRGALATEPSVAPAKVSGYLNVIGGADQSWKTRPGQTADTSGRLDLQGVVRLRGVVLETEASYDGAVDGNRCAVGSLCAYEHKAGMKRRGSRATYDFPDEQLRLQIGDVDATAASYVRSTDTLGVSLEKSSRKLAPGESIRSTGHSAFRVDRQSEVDVIVNGAVIQHFQLRPGAYNLRDLPFAGGANEVELAITDDSGERKSLKFSMFHDQSLLAAGKTEWSLSAGAPSYLLDGDRKYETRGRTGAALLRHGITDDLTTEVSAQADMHVATGSIGLFLQSSAGVFSVQPAASTTEGKIGLGGRASWDVMGFRGSFGARESLRISADYRDKSFRTPGDQIELATQVFRPQALYKLRLTGSHSIALPEDLTATLSARYQFDNPEATAVSPYVVRGDRYGADLTLSKPLTPWMSGSILAGYSNETYLHGFAANFNNTKAEFRAAARLYIRPAERTSIGVAYDTLNKSTQISALQMTGDGLGRWDTAVSAQHVGDTGSASVGGSLGYTGNRADVRVSHSAGGDNFTYPKFQPSHEDQRTSLRVGTAIAFADGMVAVGAPIRGGAFAIVKPHASIADKDVTVGSDGTVIAKTDRLGPALVSNLPAYANTTVPVDVADLPIGYSLGSGGFDIRAPYKSGYALEVGSAYSITAFGALVDQVGQPLSLQSGVAFPIADGNKKVAVFTNAAGRFGADGLSPGRWTLRMESADGPLVYMLDIPAKTEGLFKAGTLSPTGAAAKE